MGESSQNRPLLSRPLSPVRFTVVALLKSGPLIATLLLGPVLGETKMSVGADQREAE